MFPSPLTICFIYAIRGDSSVKSLKKARLASCLIHFGLSVRQVKWFKTQIIIVLFSLNMLNLKSKDKEATKPNKLKLEASKLCC